MTPVQEIIAEMRDATDEDKAIVENAYEFGKDAHADEKRYSGEPYFIHPAATAKILASYGMDASTIAAGLLHDTIEDSHTTPEEIEALFGPEVRFLIEGVTKLGKHKYRGAERHAESLRRLLVASASDIRVLIVKLADRYHNMTTLDHVPEAKRRRIALETLEIYAPLADRLGIGRLKKELEDLAFPYVDPDAYAHTMELRKLKSKETEEGLRNVQKELQKELAKRGVKDFHTDIRVKGLWSLHQKLLRKNDDITKIHDVAALRVVVPNVDDCYTALGIIHSLWRPLPGEFKDYIAYPKPNGYRSLHTTVVTRDAGIVEIQIRTEEMHKHAQFGIASHMSYKQLGKEAAKGSFSSLSFTWMRSLIPSLLNFSKKPAEAAPEAEKTRPGKKAEAPRWLAELAEAHETPQGSQEFVAGLKEDFFSHRVFVFTPKSDVVDMPVGATPIDFAYAIHSDLGNHMNGAKVNGKLVAIDSTLHNGDVVEIMRRDTAHPTTKWLDAAKTTLARRHIRTTLGLNEVVTPQNARKTRAPRVKKDR